MGKMPTVSMRARMLNATSRTGTRQAVLRAAVGCCALALALAAIAPALAADTLIEISHDIYTNSASQHQSQVEPDTLAIGSTIVSAFQSGRYFNGGSSNIGFATSTDDGATWTHGFLNHSTKRSTQPGPYDRASDASVAFDAKHNVWMISWLGIRTPDPTNEGSFRVDVLVTRSTNGGLNWGPPVVVNPNPGASFLDKNWSVCDNTPSSPFFGNCYTQFDDTNRNDLMEVSTSIDGGQSWGTPRTTADPPDGFSIPAGTNGAHGLGGQPLVQPDGRLVVPYVGFDVFFNPNLTFAESISSFVSVDGGNSLSASSLVAGADSQAPRGNLRAATPLPSAEIDHAGKIYLAWQDCRFEPQCNDNDIVFSTSTTGIQWSAVHRIPLDAVGSGRDHFLPGLGVDRNSSGTGAHLALVYYFYPNGNCTVSTCQLEVGFASSRNGGSSWSPHETLAGPMHVSWLPNTNQGFMVGDYFSTSIPAGTSTAVPVFEVASPPTGSKLNQPTFAIQEDVVAGSALAAEVAVGAEPVLGSIPKPAASIGGRPVVIPKLPILI
jgi:hypothetical protein